MAQELARTDAMPFGDMQRLAEAVAKSRLFGITTVDQALVLMAISQAEGRHPALAARDYDIIQNRPAKKAEAMLRDFLAAGGKVQWHELSDAAADATFAHPQGGTVRIKWDMARAKMAGLDRKENYLKFPRPMLRSRTVSEGVRTVWPMATSGFYVPEEVAEFRADPIDVTPAAAEADLAAFAAADDRFPPATVPDAVFLATAENAARRGPEAYERWWKSLSNSNKRVIAPEHERLKELAKHADDADDATEPTVARREIPPAGSQAAPSATQKPATAAATSDTGDANAPPDRDPFWSQPTLFMPAVKAGGVMDLRATRHALLLLVGQAKTDTEIRRLLADSKSTIDALLRADKVSGNDVLAEAAKRIAELAHVDTAGTRLGPLDAG